MANITREWSVSSNYRRLVAIVLVATSGTFAGSLASAQTTKQIDVSGGYLNVMGSMHGGNTQVEAELNRRWSVIGEFDWSRGRDCAGCDPVYNDLAGLGGARFRWLRDGRVSPFWQVMAGGLQSTAADSYVEYCCGLGRRLEPGFTISYLAIQPGGGVTAMISRRVGLVAQADMQLAIPDQNRYEGVSMFPRFVAGAVIRLGGAK